MSEAVKRRIDGPDSDEDRRLVVKLQIGRLEVDR
jgi:hypothetical protein